DGIRACHVTGVQMCARPIWRRRRRDRRVELHEALLGHPAPDRGDDRRAEHDVPVQMPPAEVEEAIAEPCLLRILLVTEDGQRKRPEERRVGDERATGWVWLT